MKVVHYYHVYAAGAWGEPVREHIEALGKSRFPGDISVGLIGRPEDRRLAREMIKLRFIDAGLPAPAEWFEADEGFEQFTLSALREFALNTDEEHAVLYAHTKGALDNSPWNACWRQSMTRHVVGHWRQCAELLESGSYDTVGCHWLTSAHNVVSPFYGGNFWWARSGYLRTLPPLDHDNRWRAEEWIGLGNPRAYDLLPGWPTMELCAP